MKLSQALREVAARWHAIPDKANAQDLDREMFKLGLCYAVLTVVQGTTGFRKSYETTCLCDALTSCGYLPLNRMHLPYPSVANFGERARIAVELADKIEGDPILDVEL